MCFTRSISASCAAAPSVTPKIRLSSRVPWKSPGCVPTCKTRRCGGTKKPGRFPAAEEVPAKHIESMLGTHGKRMRNASQHV